MPGSTDKQRSSDDVAHWKLMAAPASPMSSPGVRGSGPSSTPGSVRCRRRRRDHATTNRLSRLHPRYLPVRLHLGQSPHLHPPHHDAVSSGRQVRCRSRTSAPLPPVDNTQCLRPAPRHHPGNHPAQKSPARTSPARTSPSPSAPGPRFPGPSAPKLQFGDPKLLGPKHPGPKHPGPKPPRPASGTNPNHPTLPGGARGPNGPHTPHHRNPHPNNPNRRRPLHGRGGHCVRLRSPRSKTSSR